MTSLAHRKIDVAHLVMRDERGAGSTELVLAMPLLMMLLLTIVQFTLWAHASHIAQATAAQALAVTRVANATPAAGQTEAALVLRQLGDGALRRPHITVQRTAENAAVHINGTVTTVVPFLDLTAHGDATGPIEHFRPDPPR